MTAVEDLVDRGAHGLGISHVAHGELRIDTFPGQLLHGGLEVLAFAAHHGHPGPVRAENPTYLLADAGRPAGDQRNLSVQKIRSKARRYHAA